MTKIIYTISDCDGEITSWMKEKDALKEFKNALKQLEVEKFFIENLVNEYKQKGYAQYQEYEGEMTLQLMHTVLHY